MVSTERSRTRFAVLGFLAGGPKSGYEVRGAISRSTSFFWNESFGQIYPILAKLAAEGLVKQIKTSPAGRRVRQKYAITPAGMAALRKWLETPAQPEIVRNEMLLKLFFSDYSTLEEAKIHIAQATDRAARRISVFGAIRAQGLTSNHLYAELALEYGLAIEYGILDWSKKALQILNERGPGKMTRSSQDLPRRGRRSNPVSLHRGAKFD